MKFEEVLPALRAGKKITNSIIKNSGYQYIYYLDKTIFCGKGGVLHLTGKELVEIDDWEIVKEKKKVKIRDLTEEQFKKYCKTNIHCRKCPFFCVASCSDWHDKFWMKHKDLYSDKFLDQKIKIEE